MADLTIYGDCDPRFERVRGTFVENHFPAVRAQNGHLRDLPLSAMERDLTVLPKKPSVCSCWGEAGLHSASACGSPSLLRLSSMHHGVRNSRRTASAPYTSLYARSQACDPSMPVLTATPFDAFNNER
jgi:hypothetical protein